MEPGPDGVLAVVAGRRVILRERDRVVLDRGRGGHVAVGRNAGGEIEEHELERLFLRREVAVAAREREHAARRGARTGLASGAGRRRAGAIVAADAARAGTGEAPRAAAAIRVLGAGLRAAALRATRANLRLSAIARIVTGRRRADSGDAAVASAV